MSLLARVVNRFILVAKRKPSSAITLILTFGTVSFVFYRDIEPNRPVKTILVWNAPERAEIVAEKTQGGKGAPSVKYRANN